MPTMLGHSAASRPTSAGERLQALDRAMPILEERLGRLNPSPVRERMPILIGGGGEKVTLRIVVEHAHIWNGFGDLREAGRKSKILDGWCERAGRDPNEFERSVLIRPNQIKNADAYVENGITHLMLGFTGPDYNLSPLQ